MTNSDNQQSFSRGHYIAIGVAVLSFIILYFGFDIKPKSRKELEKSRSLNIEATSIENLIMEARDSLGSEFSVIEALNLELKSEESDSLKIEKLKQLSGKWYELGFPAIAGYFAEEVAQSEETPEAWSIAGTTYFLALADQPSDKVETWASNRAINALETAISLDPDDIDHKINLALVYVERPPQNNPMKGILMLRDLNEQNPDNIKVLSQLGRLSLVTNQLDNALKRLKRAEELDPDNKNVACLLAKAYRQMGNKEMADIYDNKCFN